MAVGLVFVDVWSFESTFDDSFMSFWDLNLKDKIVGSSPMLSGRCLVANLDVF